MVILAHYWVLLAIGSIAGNITCIRTNDYNINPHPVILHIISSPRWPPRAKREITFFIPALQIRLKIVTFAAASK